MRGFGDEKFGLPLPANLERRSAESNRMREKKGMWPTRAPMAQRSVETRRTTRRRQAGRWRVRTGVLDAVESVEEELMHHASENDILSSYINETLMELRRRPANSVASSKASTSASLVGRVDPSLSL
ncbi:hypothetical protein L1887_60625 [Cichorium endivia]|nr:hypothetical protein L1887_60625 [Cichorium endivia]